MTFVDWLILLVLAGFVVRGIATGFLRAIFALAGLLCGLVLASWNYQRAAQLVRPLIRWEAAADALGFLLVALVVMLICSLAGKLVSTAVHTVGLGCLDRIAGAAFGFFQGAFFVTLCILVTLAFFPGARWLENGRLPHYFFGTCHLTTHVSPGSLAGPVRKTLHRLEQQTPDWSQM